MRDLNQDSTSWPLYYGDKTLTNGQYYNGFLPRAVADSYSEYDKDVVKRTMLQHEAIFKDQVYELHRLYRIQIDLMDEVKRKELHKNQMAVESSLSSSPLNSQITSEDARKWQIPSFPLANSVCARPSISGIEDIHSPLSSIKGSSTQARPLPFQNGGSSKEVELLDSRPSKVRRKMIDLQLPADAYIDTEEEAHCRDETKSATSSYLPNGSQKIAAESGVKLYVGDSENIGCQKEVLRSDSYLSRTNGLADLNEPIPTEETNTSRYLDLLGRAPTDRETKDHELSAKLKSQLPRLLKEVSRNSHLESSNGSSKNRHLQNNENGRGWFSPMFEAGPSKSVSQGLQNEKSPISSQPIQVLFNKAQEHPPFLLTDQSKVDLWRERTIHGLEVSEKNRDISNNNLPESVVASSIPSSYPVASSSDLFNSWSHSASTWEKPRSCLNEKSISVQTLPFLNSSDTLTRNSHTSAQSYGIFGDGWHLNRNSRPNLSLESELPKQNGFYQRSSAGSKEPLVQVPSVSYNYVNYGNNNHFASENVITHGSAKLCNGSSSTDMKAAKDVSLNVVLSNRLQDSVPQRNVEVEDEGRKQEDPVAILPWLRAKPSSKNEGTNTGRDLNAGDLSFLQSSLNQSVNKNETGSSPMFAQKLKSGSGSKNVEASRVERNDFSSSRKILGFPILEKPHISANESSSLTSPSVSVPPTSEVEVEENKKNRVLDINLPFDAAVPDLSQQGATEALVLIEKKSDVRVAGFRHEIDLNSCVSEDEASFMPAAPSSNVKTSGIDLEAPIVPETEEMVISGEESPEKALKVPLQQRKTELVHDDDVARAAAEAIVWISSSASQIRLDDATCNSSEASIKDPLNWFVEIISACGDDIMRKFDAALRGKDGEDNGDSSSEELDYFEYMTLKLTETKEEDYMPQPLVPENLKFEETGTTVLPNRPRKGQARRGRQRRDFQRDILPGLASLSRHEVTEDLQTFGGMMRATGHSWSALTRRNSTRNGSARGRRRAVVSPPPPTPATIACSPLVQQLVNIEVVALDDKSLTGWGKTTRRPRRQRCPAGNPPALLT